MENIQVESRADAPVPLTQTLTEKMAAGVLVISAAGFIIAANDSAAALLAMDRATLISTPFTRFWPHELQVKCGSGESYHPREMLQDGDGRDLCVDLTITSAPDSYLVSLSPCAGVAEVNEALTRMQRLAGIGLLTTSVAHELNTPISVIAATCSNILHEQATGTLSAAQLVHYAQLIDQSAWRAARTLEVLRNYSYDEDIHPAVTDLNLIVEDALTLVRQQFQSEFNITIETDLSPRLKSIICDHNRLTQVLITLLDNARDSMPEGGIIRVRTWVLDEKEMGLNGRGALQSPGENDLNGFAAKWPAGLQHGIAISDTGSGISPAMKEQIFDPFFTTKPAGRGTGLGLYIARQIVAQHNGRLHAANNPEGGATFTILLPRKP